MKTEKENIIRLMRDYPHLWEQHYYHRQFIFSVPYYPFGHGLDDYHGMYIEASRLTFLGPTIGFNYNLAGKNDEGGRVRGKAAKRAFLNLYSHVHDL